LTFLHRNQSQSRNCQVFHPARYMPSSEFELPRN